MLKWACRSLQKGQKSLNCKVMGPVWLQQFMQVTKEFIINLQHIFLLQVSILDLGLCIGGGGCAALYQHSKEAKRKVQGQEWHLRSLSDQHVWAEVCPLPVRCRAGDEQEGRMGSSSWKGLLKECRKKWKGIERLNFSVPESPAVKPHVMCHTVCW